MKTKLLFVLLLLLPVMAFAQKRPRQILHGKVIADSLQVDRLSVMNINSRIGAVTDEDGFFTIYARPTDTLFFSSITFRSMHLVLKEKDFIESTLIVKLDVNVTLLDEVVINPKVLSGQLDKDSKNTKTLRATSDMDSYKAITTDVPRPTANVNTALPSNVAGSPLTGVDLGKIYRTFFKKRKKKDAGEIYGQEKDRPFQETVKERFTHHFFIETLKIPHEEIGLFLNFCDKGKETSWMLDPKSEFQLTEYLVSKSKEYLKKEK